MVLWDYVIERRYFIHNTITRQMFQINLITPHELTLSSPEYIIIICVCGLYEWTYYCDLGDFPENRDK